MLVKKVVVDKADRLYQLPPDLKSFIPRQRSASSARKTKPINLASFNWPIAFSDDLPLTKESLQPANPDKLEMLRDELTNWFMSHRGIRIDSLKEVFIGPGISGMLMHLATAFVDPGDIVFMPDLCLPLYRRIITASGGQPVSYGISARNRWAPDFERINSRIGRVARLLFLNSPHNPTGAELTQNEMADLVWIASRENIAVVNDAAYAGVPERPSVSLLAVHGGKKVGIEIGSFSYTFGLPWLPLGFAVGNYEVISGLEQVKNLFRVHIPNYTVDLALKAVRQHPNPLLRQIRKELDTSSAEAVKLLDLLGLEKTSFDTVPFVWAKIKRRRQSSTVTGQLYRRLRIQVLPGVAFGDCGEGYLRFSLTAPADQYQTAYERAKQKLRLLKPAKEK